MEGFGSTALITRRMSVWSITRMYRRVVKVSTSGETSPLAGQRQVEEARTNARHRNDRSSSRSSSIENIPTYIK